MLKKIKTNSNLLHKNRDAVPGASKFTKPDLSSRTVLITLVFLQVIPYGFGCATFFVLAPEMKQAFDWSYTQLGVINAFCQFAMIVMSYTAIWIILFLGPRSTMAFAMLISTFFFFVLSVNSSPFFAAVSVVALMGVAAVAWVPLVPLISMSVSPEKRGRILAMVCSGPPIAMVLVSCFAPYVIENYNWRFVWGVTGVISLLILISCLPFLYRIPLKETGTEKGKTTLPLKLTGLFCLFTFINGMGDMPILSYLGTVLQDRAGFSVSDSGTAWFLCGMGGILSGPFLGNILDRLNSARKTLIYALPMLAVSAGLLVFTQNRLLLFSACFILGLHHMAIYGIHGAYLSRTMSLSQSTRAFGLVNVSYGLGAVAGNYLVGYFRDLTGDFLFIYSLLVLMLLTGAAVAYKLPGDTRHSST